MAARLVLGALLSSALLQPHLEWHCRAALLQLGGNLSARRAFSLASYKLQATSYRSQVTSGVEIQRTSPASKLHSLCASLQ